MVRGVLALERLRRGSAQRKRVSRMSLRTLVLAIFALIGDAAYAAFEEFVITSDPGDGYYAAGDAIDIRADFDETVEAHNDPELKLRLTVGTAQRLATAPPPEQASTPITTATSTPVSARSFTFRYVVQDRDQDADGISVAAGAFVDGHFEYPTTNARVNVAAAMLAPQLLHRVDAVRPEVVDVVVTSDPGADNTYGIGDHIEIEVNFDEDISVEGRPQLHLSVGTNTPGARPGPLTRRAALVRTLARRLVFRYVVQGGDEDGDGVRIDANALRGGTIEDVAGNPARRAFAAVTATGHNVDGVGPSVQGVEIVGGPARGNTYGRGEAIVVEVTFADGSAAGDQSVYLNACGAGEPSLDLSIGANNRRAQYVTGSGTARLVFRYMVLAQDEDADGISIAADALRTGGCVEDATGNSLADPTRIVPVQQQAGHRVDGGFVTPAATGVRILSEPPLGQDGNYRLGDELRFAVDFNVPVHARADADDESAQLVFAIGGRDARATLVGGGGTRTLMFRYVVRAGDTDDDGISIAPNALDGGVIQDADGNNVVRRTVGLASDGDHKVDAVRPSAKSDGITISCGNTCGLGQPINVEVELNEPVWVTESDNDQLGLVLSIGARSRAAHFIGGSGTSTLRFRYVVRRGDTADSISVGPNALVGGTIVDAAGNMWGESDRRLTPHTREQRVDASRADDSAPLVEEDGVRFVVRARMPTESSCRGRPTRSTCYGLGEVIRVEVKFNETVYASGSPTLALEIGAARRRAQLGEGSGSDTLEFRYTVQANDRDADGVTIGPDALSGGTIVDAAGNEAVREFDPVSAQESRIRVDGIAPVAVTVDITSDPETDDTYGIGETIKVDVQFAEEVYVTETGSELQLVLSVGEHSRHARYVTGSGSDTLEFAYVVQTGDFDDDGISIAPDALVGGLIEDSAGNDWGEAQRRLPPTAQHPDHQVDGGGGGAVPAVERVEIDSTPLRNRKYRLGEDIDVVVKFDDDDEVYVVEAGEIALLLSVGEHTRRAEYVDGSGTNELLFRYTVQDGDYDDDGISVGAGALVGGTIQDDAGNPVRREFSALAAQSRHMVDARRPAATTAAIASTPFRGDTYRVGENIEVEVVFNEPVDTTGDEELLLTIGEENKTAGLEDHSRDRRTLTFRYRVQRGDEDANGIAIAADALRGDNIVDDDGNPAVLALTALADQSAHKVNGAPVASAFEVLPLTLGQAPVVLDLGQLLAELDIDFAGQFAPPRNTLPDAVTAEISGRRLVLTPRTEGRAEVLVTDSDCGLADEVCAIALAFVVTVQANPAEVAVLKESLAAVGRSLMAGAANTIGARLEMSKYGPHAIPGGRRFAPHALDDNGARSTGADPFHLGSDAGDPLRAGAQWPQRARHLAPAQLLRRTAFEMPLVGGSRGRSSWALWGAGDYQTVAGKPDQGSYDAEVASVYLGLDGRGDSWVAGGAVSRTRAEADYGYSAAADSVGAVSGKGTVTTDLTAFHPYMQWSLGRKGQAWLMGGFGTGEAELEREGSAAPAPSDVSMTMGMAGMRLELGRPGGLDFALRGDIGTTELETEDGVRALDDIAVSTQRARIGVEASLPLVIEGGSALTPFVDVGARVDEGDGETGNGVEVAAGVRYGGKTVRFEAKARQLVMHDDEEYEESGASATLVVAPGSNGRGLSLSVAPRWGGAADATDALWRRDDAFSAANAAREAARGFQDGDARWGVAGRIGYGMPLKQRKGTVTPFGEVDMASAEQQRTRLGVKYAIDRLGGDGAIQFEFSGERVERARGTEHRFSVTAQGRF